MKKVIIFLFLVVASSLQAVYSYSWINLGEHESLEDSAFEYMPFVDHYYAGKGGPESKKGLRVALPYADYIAAVPRSIKKSLETRHIPDKDVSFYILVFNTSGLKEPYRLSMHNAFAHWHGKLPKIELFMLQKNLPVGFFQSRNIVSREISFDSLGPVDVHIHPAGESIAFSPNNARFTIGGDVGSGWFLFVEPDLKKATIAYVILGKKSDNPFVLESHPRLKTAKSGWNEVWDLPKGVSHTKDYFDAIKDNPLFRSNGEWKAALEAFRTIIDAAYPELAAPITALRPVIRGEEKDPLENLLIELKNELNVLRRKLGIWS